MGVAEFELLKKNLIQSMKIETVLIPALTANKVPTKNRINKAKGIIETQKNTIERINKSVKTLKNKAPMNETQRKNLEQQMNEDKKSLSTPRMPVIKLIHHIYVGLLGMAFWLAIRTIDYDPLTNAPTKVWILYLVLSYPIVAIFWIIWNFTGEIILSVWLDDENKLPGVVDGEENWNIGLEWPPYPITGRTRRAWYAQKEYEKQSHKMKSQHGKLREKIKQESEYFLHNSITSKEKELVSAKQKLKNLQEILNQVNQEMKNLESEIIKMSVKMKELQERVSYLIPFSTELS